MNVFKNSVFVAIGKGCFVTIRIHCLPSPKIGAHLFERTIRFPSKLTLGQWTVKIVKIR